MKISREWLGDYVELPDDVDSGRIMHDLTMATVEVEAALELAEALRGVVVGRIDAVEPLRAESLSLAQCDVAQGRSLAVVCGARNLKTGMLVPVALPGARVTKPAASQPIEVAPRAIAGVTSEAMICGAGEIGLQDLFPGLNEYSVPDLAETACPPGTALSAALGWRDVVFEIDNKSLTHRPDLWGHLGIARELAAIYGLPFKAPPRSHRDFPHAELLGTLDSNGCHRFTATRIQGLRPQPTPLWMRSRLARIGQRSLGFLVDLSNYVMFAVGQPNHAYDARRVTLPLSVRRATQGERLRMLDQHTYTLDSNILTIADRTRAIGLAGVMGGADSGVEHDTAELILEVASFDAVHVRKASQALGLRTEASARFEKGIDTQRVDLAIDLFVELLRGSQSDARVTGFHDLTLKPTAPLRIEVGATFLRERLGKPLPVKDMASKLTAIGFDVESNGDAMRVTVPSWRATGDVSRPHDLIEEIARLIGYDNFAFMPPKVELRRQAINRHDTLERRVKELLAYAGLQEVVSYPWAKDRFLEAAGIDPARALALAAPPAPDQRCLQPSIIPNVLESVVTNLRYFEHFRLFEVGPVFDAEQAVVSNSGESLPRQRRQLGAALVGPDARALFRAAKGLLSLLRRAAHLRSLEFTPDTSAPWADASARLGLAANAAAVGALGVLTQRAKRLAGIKRGHAVLFELDIGALEASPSRDNRYQPLPEFPEVDFDLSLVFADATPWQVIADTARRVDPLIRDVGFVDQYYGAGIAPGKKSLTLRLRLGADTRTLRSEEINDAGARVAEVLQTQFQAERR
jgi:phenylalanyl-tRNA synthetase beta chain